MITTLLPFGIAKYIVHNLCSIETERSMTKVEMTKVNAKPSFHCQ